MATVPIRALHVPEPFRIAGYNTDVVAPGSGAADIQMGAPVVLSSGLLAAAAEDGTNHVDHGQLIFAITNEKFREAQFEVDSVPIRQTKISVTMLLPGIPVQGNFYHDADAGSDNNIAESMRGTKMYCRRLTASNVYVFTDVNPAGGAGHGIEFVITGLVDPAGTTYGRLVGVLAGIHRAIDQDSDVS